MDPAVALPDRQENSEETILSSDSEISVINGTSYQFDSEDNIWLLNPEPVDYISILSDQLHGSEGPGLWLDLLPAGSLQSSGQATVGGFTTNKYAVNGAVAKHIITGSLWFDMESHALVQVELHVPAALLSVSDESASGELKITLEAQKADIPAMTVPAPLSSTQTAP
jgi:hypothetical protein